MPVIVTGRTRPGPGLGAADEGEQHRARQAKPQALRLALIPRAVLDSLADRQWHRAGPVLRGVIIS